MTPNKNICALLLDEISIKSFFTYNPHQDLVEGFEDFGYFGRTTQRLIQPLCLCHRVAAGIATMVNFSALPPEAMATDQVRPTFQLF
ncbi:hypothetical protein PoB_002901200 [Plakobranchus ocellatus]|uniref:Transposable element P transposase-like RNase H domain-containing protein n=1 Tax=Plakobranchus ocellatus TaxID=259542 RepID=A0AAV4A6J7_9GAST|nr:hypothetical protein PoB_002901200 [Plakobranchus ocellatus]